MKKVCYDCPLKENCYTESGLAKLKPGEEHECGALFFSVSEASELLNLIIHTVRTVDERTVCTIATALINHGYDQDNVLDWLNLSEDEVLMDPSNMIKQLRTETHLSQGRFASHFGLSIRTLQDWEQGRRAPAPYVLTMMERILDLENQLDERSV